MIPHITNEIKSRFYRGNTPEEDRIAIIEVGGTVGDIESQPFLEAIRQFQHDVGQENAILHPCDPDALSEGFRGTEDQAHPGQRQGAAGTWGSGRTSWCAGRNIRWTVATERQDRPVL